MDLEELNIWSNKISEIPEEILKLPKLKNIELKLEQSTLNTKLLDAVIEDDFVLAQNMVYNGADVNFQKTPCIDYSFTTPLFEAQSAKIVDLLLSNNADPKTEREKTGKISIKVWESDSKQSGQSETFLTKLHKPEISSFIKKLNL